jgi:hypothetical protein
MHTVVSIHTTPIDAYIIRGRLEAEGIPGFVLHEHHIWAKWSISQALGGVKLYVPANMLESAQSVIDRIQQGEYENDLIEQQGISKHHCPKCGSTDNGVHVWLWKLALACLFTLTIAVPYTSHLYSCNSCKHSWIERNQRPYPLNAIFISICLITFCFFMIYVWFAHYFSWKVQYF